MADPAALWAAVPFLRCPHCRNRLQSEAGGVTCELGHHFDVARQGYVSLLGRSSRTDTGDSAEMVAARASFLGAGAYQPIADAVVAAIDSEIGLGERKLLVELGAGTGYYLAASVQAHPESIGLAVDSSVRAARRAASAHPRMASIVADAWDRLPIVDAAADVVLSVFAPRQVDEICRILRPDGIFVAVTPEADHLTELIGPFAMLTVDDGKASKLAADFAPELTVRQRVPVKFGLGLNPAQVRDLVMMGPAARHLEAGAFEAALSALRPVTEATASVTVSVLSGR